MLRIHKEQMDHFRTKGRASYVERVADYVARSFPGRLGDPSREELVDRVRAAVTKAAGLGFVTELETTQLVLLLLHFGLDAERKLPWFAEVLRDRALAPLGKARALVEHARARGEEHVDAIDISQPERVL